MNTYPQFLEYYSKLKPIEKRKFHSKNYYLVETINPKKEGITWKKCSNKEYIEDLEFKYYYYEKYGDPLPTFK